MLNPEDYSFVPHEKGIIIMKDGELLFMTMPETIVRIFREYDDVAKYLTEDTKDKDVQCGIPIITLKHWN